MSKLVSLVKDDIIFYYGTLSSTRYIGLVGRYSAVTGTRLIHWWKDGKYTSTDNFYADELDILNGQIIGHIHNAEEGIISVQEQDW